MSSRLGPVGLVLIGVVSVQVGAAFAKALFGDVTPTALTFLRLLASAVLLLAVVRPRLTDRTRGDWLVLAGYAVSLATMNWAIYQSFARIPLGLAVTIEFIGPLGLALLGSRRVRDLIWVALAALGVVLLGLEPGDLDPLGVALALLAGGAWAAYILLSVHTGRRWDGVDGLAVASALAAGLLAVPASFSDAQALATPHVLLIGTAIAVLSSVIPYSCELVALRTMQPRTFGILMSLDPAAAALAAVVVLHEWLSPLQWAAVACVVVASVGATKNNPAMTEASTN